MKNGFLTSEFISQALGPYGIAFALIYFGLADSETMELVKQATSALSGPGQAAVLLLLKVAAIVGAAVVGKAGAETTKAYNAGRVQQKLRQAEQKPCEE